MWENLPTKLFNDLFCHLCHMWPGIVMEQHNIMPQSQMLFMDYVVESLKLPTINNNRAAMA